MRSLEAKGSQETQTPTVQPQSESRISVADVVGQRMPTLTPRTQIIRELIVIDQSSNLTWSNQVPLWQHGLTDGTPGRGGQPVPEGNASAQ